MTKGNRQETFKKKVLPNTGYMDLIIRSEDGKEWPKNITF